MDTATLQEEQLKHFAGILKLEDMARKARTLDELRFLIVNDTKRVLYYDQAFIWEHNHLGAFCLSAVTGLSEPVSSSPYFQSFQKLIDHLTRSEKGRKCFAPVAEDFPVNLKAEFSEISHLNPVWRPFIDHKEQVVGGLWLNRGERWSDREIVQLDFLGYAYGHALIALEKSGKELKEQFLNFLWALRKRRVRLILLAFIVLVMLLPMRLSVIVPSEVVSSNPKVIASPINGIIKEIVVEPNHEVRENNLLFILEDKIIKSDYLVSLKALAVAKADYDWAVNKSFTDVESKTKMQLLKAIVDQKETEVALSKYLLDRTKVYAMQDGIVVFSDANDWLGKPVSLGERIMVLANPRETELQMWIPVNDAITLETGAEVKVFLNTDPTNPLYATIRQTSYEAELSPEDILSFRVKAAFRNETVPPRIGLKSVAKVYGEEVTLFYYLFRKPMAYLRQITGM